MATSRNLITALSKELSSIFENDIGKAINFYEQDLPKIKYKDDEPKKFPFILIEVESGKFPQSESDDDNQCQINIITGVNQEDDEQPETLSLIDRVCLYLIENKIIGEIYEVASSIEWKIGEDEVMPFEYGVMQVSFKLPKVKSKQSEYV